jgi:hypothetical protein
MRYPKRKKLIRNATPIHIFTPLYNYWQKYGGKPGDIYLGISKPKVDERALTDGLMDITWKNHEQIRCIKAKDIQSCPVETIPNHDLQVYILKV